jgi:phosphoribosylamine--glycine ligase
MVGLLIVGAGGREAALEWKLRQSSEAEEVYVAPGNGGTTNNVPIGSTDLEALSQWAAAHRLFTVVGPETPLAEGIVDRFMEKNLEIFGPTGPAAKLEASKAYAKEFMKRHNIPTTDFKVFHDYDEAVDYAKGKDGNIAVKADGLAAGKGVVICSSADDALAALNAFMVSKALGAAGSRVVVEDVLEGDEVSCFYLSDGSHVMRLGDAQDYKRVVDGDRGPNTGGMGSHSPAPILTGDLYDQIDRIAASTVQGMRAEGIPFRGVLYLGLMITEHGPQVLEYNVRLGDPETQAILPRMNASLYPYLKACTDGTLDDLEPISWDSRAAACVVMASQGYPGHFETGKPISGLGAVSRMPDVQVFHAGTRRVDDKVVTNGGRVLGVVAVGPDLPYASKTAYAAVNKICWEGEYHRSDIGNRAVKRPRLTG